MGCLVSEDDNPTGKRVTNDAIARSEAQVGGEARLELAEYLELARDLTEFGGDLVERIADAPGEPRAFHVGAIILARILTELQACVHLVRLGYAAQAITLVATMVEMMHSLAYIGANETRAEEWMAWDDPKNAYPGIGFSKTFAAVARSLGVKEQNVKREYETVYREACMVKHGNPLAMAETNVLNSGDTILVLIGPVPSPQFAWLGHAAMQWSTRYALLAVVSFVQSYLPEEDRKALLATAIELSNRHARLSADSKTRGSN